MICNDRDKTGGNPIDTTITSCFNDILSTCQLFDLGYKDNMVTWCNNQQGESILLLD